MNEEEEKKKNCSWRILRPQLLPKFSQNFTVRFVRDVKFEHEERCEKNENKNETNNEQQVEMERKTRRDTTFGTEYVHGDYACCASVHTRRAEAGE